MLAGRDIIGTAFFRYYVLTQRAISGWTALRERRRLLRSNYRNCTRARAPLSAGFVDIRRVFASGVSSPRVRERTSQMSVATRAGTISGRAYSTRRVEVDGQTDLIAATHALYEALTPTSNWVSSERGSSLLLTATYRYDCIHTDTNAPSRRLP